MAWQSLNGEERLFLFLQGDSEAVGQVAQSELLKTFKTRVGKALRAACGWEVKARLLSWIEKHFINLQTLPAGF